MYLKVAKRVDLKSPHHTTHKRCHSVIWWTWDGLIMVIVSQYIQILNHYVAHPKWTWRDMSAMHQFKKKKQKMVEGWHALSQLLRKIKLWALHQGLRSSLPLSKVKDAYGLGGSGWDRPGALCFSHAPRKRQFLRIPGCTLSSKVSKLLRVEISWAGF